MRSADCSGSSILGQVSRYIGLGSVYFTDFILMHKQMGLTDLVSIEIVSDKEVKKRFEANKPFDCVDLRFGHTNQEFRGLTRRQADRHNLIWLDYDGRGSGRRR